MNIKVVSLPGCDFRLEQGIFLATFENGFMVNDLNLNTIEKELSLYSKSTSLILDTQLISTKYKFGQELSVLDLFYIQLNKI